MWIMVAVLYTSGAHNEEEFQANLDKLNACALLIFEKGQVPIIGVNLALPIINITGSDRFEEIVMPISLAIAQRCAAYIRVCGASVGADQEVENFISRGLPVYYDIHELPKTATNSEDDNG